MASLQELEIVVLTRNRHEMIGVMLASLRPVTKYVGKIWVSDNSTDKKTFNFITANYPEFGIIERNNLDVWEHVYTIAHEISKPYCMLLHDDDVMLPGMAGIIESAMADFHDLDACGFNGLIETNGKISGKFLHSSTGSLNIIDPDSLIPSWLYGIGITHPPFPAFLYNTISLKKAVGTLIDLPRSRVNDLLLIYLISRGRKLAYCDAEIILYRMHDANATHQICRTDWLKLKSAYKKVASTTNTVSLLCIRRKYILSRRSVTLYPKSGRIVARYMILSFLKMPKHFLKIFGRRSLFISFLDLI
jgi:hypothetical protein